MANIPMADIPNAPQLGPDPAMIGVPNANTNLSGAARNLMAAPLRQGAYDGGAQGMQAIGEAGQRVAGVLSHLSGVIAEAQNTASLAKAERILSDAFAAHEIESATKPPGEWLPAWQSKAEKLRGEVEKLPLTPGGKRQMELYANQFMGSSSIQLAGKANKQIIEDSRLEVRTSVKRNAQAGQYENAVGRVYEGVKDGLFSKAEGDAIILEVETEQQQNIIFTNMNDDPEQFRFDLRDGKYDGEISESEKIKLDYQAQGILRKQQAEAVDSVENRIASGDVKNTEDIDTAAELLSIEPRYVEALKSSFQRNYVTTPEGKAEIAKFYEQTQRKIDAYAEGGTRDDDAEYEIQLAITSLPDGQKEILRGRFQDATKEIGSGPVLVDTRINKAITSLLDDGAFGVVVPSAEVKKLKGENLKKAALENLTAMKKADALRDKWKAHKKTNPNLSNEDAMKWLNGETQEDVRNAVSKGIFPASSQSQEWDSPSGVGQGRQKTAKELEKEIDDALTPPAE
jgi:hypothetical protein